VVTKTASSPDVHELSMDEAEFERRHQNQSDVFRNTVTTRTSGGSDQEVSFP